MKQKRKLDIFREEGKSYRFTVHNCTTTEEESTTGGHIQGNIHQRRVQSVDVGDISETLTSQVKQPLASTEFSNVITQEHLQHNITQVCSDSQSTTATILTSIDISGPSNLNKTDSKMETTIKVSPQLTHEDQTDNDNQQKIKTVTKSSNNRQNT